MSIAIKNTADTAEKMPMIKRGTAVLSDGSVACCIVDNNIAGGAGDGTGIAKIYIYHSSDRVTFTLKNTITPPTAIYGTNYYPRVAMAIGPDNSLHLAWVQDSDNQVRYQKYTFAAGPVWTLTGTTEVVKGPPGAGFTHFRIDIDVHSTLGIPVISAVSGQSNNFWNYNWFRRTSDSTWRELQTTIWTTQGVYHTDVTVAWDKSAATGPSGRTNFAVAFSKTASGDFGDEVKVYSADTAAGAAAVLVGTQITNLNINQGARFRKNWLFSTAANEWTICSAIGTTSASMSAYRFKVAAGGSTITITGAYQRTRQALAYQYFNTNFASITYADEKFVMEGTGSNGLVYSQNGSIVRNVDGTSTISMSAVNYAWDNFFQSSGTRFPHGHYGGGNSFVVSGFSKLDTMFADGPNGAITVLPTAGNPQTFRHQYNYANVAPKNVTPSAGAASTTNVPALSALVDLDVNNPQGKVKVRWQVASNNTFTTNLRTIDEADTAFRLVANTSTGVATVTATSKVPDASALFTGTWYVRATYISELGQLGTWSAAQSFTVGHPPSASNLSPSGDTFFQYVDVAGSTNVTFSWKFSDPSPTDHQSAYQIVVENALTGASVVNTGKVTSIVNSAIVGIPSTAKDIQLRWKVTVWDVDDAAGPVSGYQTFYVGDPPTVNVDAPINASTVSSAQPTITFTPTVPGSRFVKAYRVVITRDLATDVVVLDSNWLPVASTGPFSYTLPSPVLVNTANYFVDVYVRDDQNLEGTDRNSFSTSWTAPAAPSFTVDEAFYDSLGYVKVTWTNASVDADFLSWRLYRRQYDPVGPTYGTWILLYETEVNQASYEYHDWLATSQANYEYAVVQVADRFNSAIESVYNPDAVFLKTAKYWLIHPLDDTLNIALYVNNESFEELYEEEEYHVLDRGMHVDYGDRLGYKGTLDVQVRDNLTFNARAQRLQIQDLKAAQIPVYMRNPFGDLWLVNVKGAKFDRVPGMGEHEAVNVTLDYTEISS